MQLCCAMEERSKNYVALVDRSLKTMRYVDHPEQKLLNTLQVMSVVGLSGVILVRDEEYLTLVDTISKKAYTGGFLNYKHASNSLLLHIVMKNKIVVYTIHHSRKSEQSELKRIEIQIKL